MADYTCGETEVVNSSGRTVVASMFGKTLLNGESFTVPGDVFSWLAGKFPGIKGRRMIEKMRDLMNSGVLTVLTAPSAPCGFGVHYGSSSSSSGAGGGAPATPVPGPASSSSSSAAAGP